MCCHSSAQHLPVKVSFVFIPIPELVSDTACAYTMGGSIASDFMGEGTLELKYQDQSLTEFGLTAQLHRKQYPIPP